MIRCRGCKSPVPPSLSFLGTCHGAAAPRGLWVTQLRLGAARQTSTEDYGEETNKQGCLRVLAAGVGNSRVSVMKPLTEHTYAQTHTLTWTALNPPQLPSWSSRGILDRVKDIMGQIEMMWWGGCVYICVCVCVCVWLIDGWDAVSQESVRDDDYRQGRRVETVVAPGYSDWSVDRFIIEVCFPPYTLSLTEQEVSGCASQSCLLL